MCSSDLDTATGTLEIVPDSGGASVTALSFDDPRFSATATLPSTVWASLPLTVEVAFSAKGVAPGRYTSALTVTTSSDSAEVATVVATVE